MSGKSYSPAVPGYAEESLKYFLEKKYRQYNNPEFIANDPISIPHGFEKLQDIEIIGFWAAMLSWGQRKTIINKCHQLISLMGGKPHEFVLNYKPEDLKPFLDFKHRTFTATDTLYFLEFFQNYYRTYESLEDAFLYNGKLFDAEKSLNAFRINFFQGEYPVRTLKHVSCPDSKSTCKRLNMFLRWMVRSDGQGVDFGLWKRIPSSALKIPLDLHVDRVARKLQLITRKQCDWKTVLELNERLVQFDAEDPVKYDFALFNLGIEEKF